MRSCFVRLAGRSNTIRRTLIPGLASLALGVAATAAHAQLVSPKSIPVLQDGQFAVFPSAFGAMASSMALDDTLLDPFVNPARAARIQQRSVFGAPFLHGISDDRGGGSTLPLGGYTSSGDWAAAGLVALQRMDNKSRWGYPQNGYTPNNQFAALSVARRLGNGVSVGMSGFWAALTSTDGARQLYAGANGLSESGQVSDIRVGVSKELPSDGHVDLLLLRNRFDVAEDVGYETVTWNTLTPATDIGERYESNRDRSDTYGVHARYVQPIGIDGWSLGWIATANKINHPHIADYTIQQVVSIPRDPGTTYGYNLGMGAANTDGHATFSMEAIVEPIYSSSWATASSAFVSVAGATLNAGDHTVDNRFHFTNDRLRFGFANEMNVGPDTSTWLGLQLGLDVYHVKYRLHQTDHVFLRSATSDQHWTETTPSIGFRLRGSRADVMWTFRLTCTDHGSCDLISMGDKVTNVTNTSTSGGAVLAAPTGPLWFNSGHSYVQQLMISIPIR